MQRYMLSGGQVRKEADGHWVSFDSAFLSIAEARKQGEDGKIAYGRASFENGRKQGAEEGAKREREEILGKVLEMFYEAHRFPLYDLEKWIKARGAAEPVCCCVNAYTSSVCPVHGKPPKCTCGWPRENHKESCPFHKQAEPKQDYCDCGRHEDGEGNQIHYPPCPCYKPPESPPLYRLSSYDDREVADKVDELIDRVNRIEARGRP